MVWHANLACREACFSPDARTNLHEKSRLVIGLIDNWVMEKKANFPTTVQMYNGRLEPTISRLLDGLVYLVSST